MTSSDATIDEWKAILAFLIIEFRVQAEAEKGVGEGEGYASGFNGKRKVSGAERVSVYRR